MQRQAAMLASNRVFFTLASQSPRLLQVRDVTETDRTGERYLYSFGRAQWEESMHNKKSAPYALWFLRLTLAIALLVHVQFNLGAFDRAAATHWLGLPAGVSLFGITVEICVAFALILGIWPRVAALAGAAVLISAIVQIHAVGAHPNWTAPAAWIGALLLLSLCGDGAFTLVPTAARRDPKRSR